MYSCEMVHFRCNHHNMSEEVLTKKIKLEEETQKMAVVLSLYLMLHHICLPLPTRFLIVKTVMQGGNSYNHTRDK